MDLIEYKAKEVFKKYGLPTPRGLLVRSASDINSIEKIAPRVVLKAQVPIGGRGKAGGIRFASSTEEARSKAAEMLGMSIKGFKVGSILVEEALDVGKELYLSVTIDRGARDHLIIGASEGGVEIESLPDEKLIKVHVRPLAGLHPYQVRDIVKKYPLSTDQQRALGDILRKLFTLYVKEDATLAEINPLVLTKDGRLIAADAKLSIDDDALFRHKEYEKVETDLTPLELKAKQKGIALIQLDGRIGVIANGAGLTMATLDSLELYGGKGGVFMDLGGTDDAEMVREAFLLLVEADPSVILMNLFGGITKCDTVAEGIKGALSNLEKSIPTVVRIRGLNEERAREILRDAGFVPCETMAEAAKTAVEMERKLGGR